TNDEILANRIYALRNHGMQMLRARYDCIMPGFNYRMNELEAVLGLVQLREIERHIAERRRLANLYVEALRDVSEISFQAVLPQCVTVWQAFVIRLHNISAKDAIAHLRATGIEASIGTYAVHMLKFYAEKYGISPSDYPNAAELYAKSIALPFFNGMTPQDIKHVCETLRGVVNEDRTS
ncbi:MAG TPA: hypothetical protein EYP10_01525, partial [Armatimonadetes bacterium]|nr:hypothetical protein [Armatimonadota bacterium]